MERKPSAFENEIAAALSPGDERAPMTGLHAGRFVPSAQKQGKRKNSEQTGDKRR